MIRSRLDRIFLLSFLVVSLFSFVARRGTSSLLGLLEQNTTACAQTADGMEGDQHHNNHTNEAEAPTEQHPRTTEEIIATTAQIEVKDFSQDLSSQDQDDAVRGEKDGHTPAQGSLRAETAAGSFVDHSGPGFVNVDGDVGGSGHNETVVDIIAVPCPGADPIQTWTYDSEFYGESSVACDFGSHTSVRTSLRNPSPWVTGKLRASASIARVLLYKHRSLEDGMTLQSLSEDLLDQVERIRVGAVGVTPRSSSSSHANSRAAITALVFHRP